MSFDKDEWFRRLDRRDVEWDTVVHPKELARLLQQDAMMACLGMINEMVEADNFAMREIDFTEQKGVAKALKLQGRGDGINDVIQMLADNAEEQEEQENAA